MFSLGANDGVSVCVSQSESRAECVCCSVVLLFCLDSVIVWIIGVFSPTGVCEGRGRVDHTQYLTVGVEPPPTRSSQVSVCPVGPVSRCLPSSPVTS